MDIVSAPIPESTDSHRERAANSRNENTEALSHAPQTHSDSRTAQSADITSAHHPLLEDTAFHSHRPEGDPNQPETVLSMENTDDVASQRTLLINSTPRLSAEEVCSLINSMEGLSEAEIRSRINSMEGLSDAEIRSRIPQNQRNRWLRSWDFLKKEWETYAFSLFMILLSSIPLTAACYVLFEPAPAEDLSAPETVEHMPTYVAEAWPKLPSE